MEENVETPPEYYWECEGYKEDGCNWIYSE